jgi:hypothetical protein
VVRAVSAQGAGGSPEGASGGWEHAGKKNPSPAAERVVVVRGGLEPPTFRFSGRATRSVGRGSNRDSGFSWRLRVGAWRPMLLQRRLQRIHPAPVCSSPRTRVVVLEQTGLGGG